MAENNKLSFFNPAEPLGGKGRIDSPSTNPLNLQPFEGKPALQDPKINFPVPAPVSPLTLRENTVGSPGTLTAADKGTLSPSQKKAADTQRLHLAASGLLAPQKAKTGVFAYDASYRSDTFYKRYHAYGQEKFDKIGFHPLLNNEALFNANTSKWNDFSRMLGHSFVPLFTKGFVAGPKSLVRALQGDFGSDTSDARVFAEAAAIGQSSKGGIGGFSSNLLMNFAYTAGIVTESAIEMGIAALLAAPTGGSSLGVAGLNLGTRSFTLGRLMGTTSKIKGALNTTEAINATRNFNAMRTSTVMANALKETKNINNARQVFNWAKYENGLGSAVGQFFNPLSQLTDGIANGLKASQNLSGWARTWAMTSHTAGGLYRNAVALNAALAESRLEGGMVENDIYYDLVQNHYRTTGEAPNKEQLDAFAKQAKAGGVTALGWNFAAIYLSNKVVFDNVFGGRNPFAKLMGKKTQDVLNLKTGTLVKSFTKQTLKTTGRVIAKPTIEFVEKNLKNTLKAWYKEPFVKAGAKTVGYFKSNIMEGLQENAQEIIADATKNYYVESFKNPALANQQFAYAQFKHAYDQQFTKQGLETFLSGFAMGFPARGLNYTIDFAGRMAERISDPVKYKEEIAKQKAYTKQLVDTLNNVNILDFYNNPAFHYGSQEELNRQLRQTTNDDARAKLFAESVKMESFIKAMTHAMKHDTMDLYYDQFDAYKDLTQAEFEEAFGLQEGEGKDYLANLANMQERAKSIENKWNEATEKFPLPDDLAEILDSLPANSPELEQAHLMISAWQEAKTNYVFFNESYNQVEQQIQKTTQAIRNVLSKFDVNSSDIQLLFDPQLMKTEIAYLNRDIELLNSLETLDEEQQEKLKLAKEKLTDLKALDEAIKNQENHNQNKQDIIESIKLNISLNEDVAEMLDSEEKIEATAQELYEQNERFLDKIYVDIEIAFKNYMRTLTENQDVELNDDALQEAADEFHNFIKLSEEKKNLGKLINKISDPQGYMDMVERNMLWMKELYDQRRGFYEEMIRKGFQNIEDNAIINKLAEQNIYISPEALEAWVTENEIPKEFFDQNKEIVIKEGHHKYDEYIVLFLRAQQSANRQKKDIVPQQFQDRIDALNEKRKAELEQLPTTEQRVDLRTIDFNNKEKTLDKIKNDIPNETYVELTYTENKKDKTLVLYRDAKGVFKYDDVNGNVFDQKKLKFNKGEVYKFEEKPDPAKVKEINDRYDALIAGVRAEAKDYERKTGINFEDITVDTPFDKIPEDLKQELQLALLKYKESIGEPLAEDASFSEEDIIEFIANNPIASQLIDAYNKTKRAQELDKDFNYDVDFVDKDGNTIKASELSSDELELQIKATLLEIKDLTDKSKTDAGLTLEEEVRLNSLQATFLALSAYKESLEKNNFTEAQLRVKATYNKAIKAKQAEITKPDKTKNHYTFENKKLTRVSNLVKDIQYLPYTNEDLLDFYNIYDEVFGKDSTLTLEKYKDFEKKFESKILKGYSVETNRKELYNVLKNLIGQKLDRDVAADLFNKYQFEESRRLGTYIHNAIEKLLNREFVELDESLITSDTYEELFGSEGIITKLVKEDLKGVMILGTENVVFNEQYAGTMDLVLVDRSGKIFIIDIKTGREKKWKDYNAPEEASREANNLQLTTYKNLLFNLTGLEAEIAILPIKVKYNKEGVAEAASFPTEVPGLLKDGKKLLKLDSTESFGEKSVQTLVNEKIPRKAPAELTVTPVTVTSTPAEVTSTPVTVTPEIQGAVMTETPAEITGGTQILDTFTVPSQQVDELQEQKNKLEQELEELPRTISIKTSIPYTPNFRDKFETNSEAEQKLITKREEWKEMFALRDKVLSTGVQLGVRYTIEDIEHLILNDNIDEGTKLLYETIKPFLIRNKTSIIFGKIIPYDEKVKEEAKDRPFGSSFYQIGTNTIVMNYSLLRSEKDFSRVVTHELTHAISSDVIDVYNDEKAGKNKKGYHKFKITDQQRKAVNELDEILSELRKDPAFKGQYGLANKHELLAELANPYFIEKLKQKKYKKSSFLNRILETILNIIGIDNYHHKLLDVLLSITQDLSLAENTNAVKQLRNSKSFDSKTTIEKELSKPIVLAYLYQDKHGVPFSDQEQFKIAEEVKETKVSIKVKKIGETLLSSEGNAKKKKSITTQQPNPRIAELEQQIEKLNRDIDTLTKNTQKEAKSAPKFGPSKQAQQFIDRILNSKSEKEAKEIYIEAEKALRPADMSYLIEAGRKARANNQWVNPTEISEIILSQVAEGDVFTRIEDNANFKVELKENKIFLEEIDGKSSVILSEANKNQFMRDTDLNKNKPETKEEPVVVTDETKQLVLDNRDEVSEFIKDSEKIANLKEEVSSVDLNELENELLNNLDC